MKDEEKVFKVVESIEKLGFDVGCDVGEGGPPVFGAGYICKARS